MKQRAPKSLALPQNKHRKLLDLRGHVPHVSKAALERILKYVALEGLPGQRSAKAMRQASKGLVDEANGYGPLLVLQDVVGQDGSISRVQFLNYCSFLHYAYKQGGGFYRAMKTQLDKHAGHLGLYLYSDEVCPGNVLAPDTTRKCWVVYAGLKEMDSLLSSEHAWVTLCIVRSSLVSRLEANISQIMGRVLQLVFENPWCAVQHAGMLLQPPPEHAGAAPRRLFLQARAVHSRRSGAEDDLVREGRLWKSLLYPLLQLLQPRDGRGWSPCCLQVHCPHPAGSTHFPRNV